LDWRYLDLADYLLIAEAVTGLDAEVLAEMPRVVNLASSALSVPSSGWQGQDAYPELAQKAGLLAARLAKNHPLPDGNKRAAWLSMIEFIERNGYRLDQPEPAEAVDAMLRLASSELAEAEFVEWLRPRLIRGERGSSLKG
jgi:death-on-curing protein